MRKMKFLLLILLICNCNFLCNNEGNDLPSPDACNNSTDHKIILTSENVYNIDFFCIDISGNEPAVKIKVIDHNNITFILIHECDIVGEQKARLLNIDTTYQTMIAYINHKQNAAGQYLELLLPLCNNIRTGRTDLDR